MLLLVAAYAATCERLGSERNPTPTPDNTADAWCMYRRVVLEGRKPDQSALGSVFTTDFLANRVRCEPDGSCVLNLYGSRSSRALDERRLTGEADGGAPTVRLLQAAARPALWPSEQPLAVALGHLRAPPDARPHAGGPVPVVVEVTGPGTCTGKECGGLIDATFGMQIPKFPISNDVHLSLNQAAKVWVWSWADSGDLCPGASENGRCSVVVPYIVTRSPARTEPQLCAGHLWQRGLWTGGLAIASSGTILLGADVAWLVNEYGGSGWPDGTDPTDVDLHRGIEWSGIGMMTVGITSAVLDALLLDPLAGPGCPGRRTRR